MKRSPAILALLALVLTVGSARADELTVEVEAPARHRAAIERALEPYLQVAPARTARPVGEDQVNAVVEALFGAPGARPDGFEPSRENRESVVRAVRAFMEAGLPIEGVTFWGGARNYGRRGPWKPELADVMALRRFEQIHAAVRAAGYPPGIKARLVLEDLGRRAMGGDSKRMQRAVAVYKAELARVARVVGPNVSFEPESEIIASREVPERARALLGLPAGTRGSDRIYLDLSRFLEQRIVAYLRESEAVAPKTEEDAAGFDAVAALPSYQALEATGFKGGIPLNQREAIRARTLKRLGNPKQLSAAALDRHVAKYFAQGFARALLDVRRGASVVGGETLAPLSFSFLTYPPGSPASLDVRRLEWKATQGKGKSEVPPWGGQAVFAPRGKRLELTIDHFSKRDRAVHRQPFELTFRRGGAAVTVPASIRRVRLPAK